MGEIFLGAGRLPNPPQAFVQWNDPQGNRLVSINRDGSVSAAGIMIGSVSPEANIVGVQFADGTIQTTAATGGIAIGLANDGNTETLTSAGITITDVNDNSITMSNAGILLADLSGNHLVLNTGIQLADTAGDSIFLFNGLTIDDQFGNSIVTSATGISITDLNNNRIDTVSGGITLTNSTGIALEVDATGVGVSGTLNIAGPSLIISQSASPRSATTAGSKGQIQWDSTHIYVCTVSGLAGHATWAAAALTTI